MSRARLIAAAVLMITAAQFSSSAAAAPRQAQVAGGEMTPDADMDVWLRQLAGRYRIEGMVQIVAGIGKENSRYSCFTNDGAATDYCQAIKGKADCIAIGDGPGVQCMLGVMWRDIYEVDFEQGDVFELPGGVSYLDPAMALFGLDPGKAGISYLLVDFKGLPEGGLGFIKGDRATFRTSCVNAPALLLAMREGGAACERILRFDIKPDARTLHWSMDIEILQSGEWVPWTRYEMTLRRVQESDEATVGG